MRTRTTRRTVVALGLGVALLMGVALGQQGADVLFILLFACAVCLLMARPAWGLCFLLALIPIQNVFVVSSGVTAVKLAGVAVVGAWAARKLIVGESFRRVLSTNYLWLGGAFFTLGLASVFWARVPGAALAGVQQGLLLFGFGVMVVDVVRTWEIAEHAARGLVIGALVAAGLALVQVFVGGARRAGDMVSGDPNATASLLLSVLPFAVYLVWSKRSRFWRGVGLVFAVAGPLAIVTTLSRFNILLLPLVILVLSFETWRAKHGRTILGLALVSMVVFGGLFLPRSLIQNRIATILPYIEGTLSTEPDAGDTVSSRGFHMRVGLAIAQEYPVFGAGYDNYGTLFLEEYQFRVVGRDQLYTSVRSPHSAHLGILADLGLVGFSVWCALLFRVGVWNALGSLRAKGREHLWSPPALLSRALLYTIGIIGFAHGLYATVEQEPLFWAVLALCTAVHQIVGAELDAAERLRPARVVRRAHSRSE